MIICPGIYNFEILNTNKPIDTKNRHDYLNFRMRFVYLDTKRDYEPLVDYTQQMQEIVHNFLKDIL